MTNPNLRVMTNESSEQNAPPEELDSMIDAIEGHISDFKERADVKIPFFHEAYELQLHRNSFCLVAGKTGSGKSTFIQQAVAFALSKGQKVCVFSNELNQGAYYNYLLIRLTKLVLDKRKAYTILARNLKVYDTKTSNGQLTQYDRCVPYIYERASVMNPDIIFFDQISNATGQFDSSERKSDFGKLEHIAREIGLKINGKDNLPPIVVTQQALGIDGNTKVENVDMQKQLRGSKNTLNDATHGIMIARTGNVTKLVVDKCRYFQKHERVTEWKLDTATFLFEPGFNDTEIEAQVDTRKVPPNQVFARNGTK